jgi:alkanesulfonate monooxygenase SsuD/methylene tetrahydromethanopterin reductase-like flavin-dependent oxidoreductase (luciferase family)
MKFGILQFFGWLDRSIPLETIYSRALDRIEIMEQTGYDAVWLAEHHFSSYSVCPSVHVMAMNIAARTKRLRIGTAVTLAPFYHPLRIAEEIALLDILSGGRINWGAGRGFDREEFEVFNVPVEESTERFREVVEIVLAAWQNERLTYKGKYHQYEDVEVLPKPAQKPHPPTWVAASSQGAVEWAAKRGLEILMDPHSTTEALAQKQRRYEKLSIVEQTLDRPIARLIAIADTEGEAKIVAERGAKFSARYVPKEAIPQFRLDQQIVDPIEHYMDDVILYGSPDKIVDDLRRLEEEIGLRYLLMSPLSERSFELFTERVLPHFL